MNIEKIYFDIETLHNKVVSELKQADEKTAQIRESFMMQVRSANQAVAQQKAEIERQIQTIQTFAKMAKVQLISPVASQRYYKVDMMQLKRISMVMGPRKNDPMAVKLYDAATGQLNTLAMELRKLNDGSNSVSQDEMARKLAEVQTQKNRIKQQFAFTLKQKYVPVINNLIMQCNEIFRNSRGTDAIDTLKPFEYRIAVGDASFVLGTCEELIPIYKDAFGAIYRENDNSLCLPCTTKFYDGQIVIFDTRDKAYDLNIALPMALRVINNIGHYMYDYIDKVIFIDPVRYNKSGLGALEELCGGSESWIETVPQNSKEVEILLEKYIDVMNADNKQENSAITEGSLCGKLFVFYDYPEGYSNKSLELISQLVANVDRFKQSMLFVHDRDMSDEAVKRINSIANVAHCIVTVSNNLHQFRTYDRSNDINVHLTNVNIFNESSLDPTLRQRFIIDRQKLLETKMVTNDYLDLVGFRNIIPDKGHRKIPAIPVGIDDKGNLVQLSFETGTKFASFLCGSAGSGKSNLLHVIVSGLIQNMHPDDIEIWLVDFKKTEFARYIDATPPHVRYVFLENSPELVYDLIDRLTEILEKRKNVFMKRRYSNLWDVPESTYMPSMFVIIDEFSEMSEIMVQAMQDTGIDYVKKMQLILAEGRALGMHFIFSSQSFTSGSKGLNDFSKQNIQQRLVMKNAEVSESRLTLDLHSPNERDTMMIEQLKPHHLIAKQSRDSHGNQLELSMVLNLSDDKDNDIIRSQYQKGYIDWMNQTMHFTKNVKDYFDCNDQNGYVDKRVLILDGNVYKSFIQLNHVIKNDLKREQSSLAPGVCLYVGEPMRMKQVMPITMVDAFNENMLFVAPVRDVIPMASVLASISESLQMQGISIEHWSDQNNLRCRQIKRMKATRGWTHVTETSGLMNRIANLEEKIKKGIPSKGDIYYVISCVSTIQLSQELFDPKDVVEEDVPETAPELDLLQMLFMVENGEMAFEEASVTVKDRSSNKYLQDMMESIKYILRRGPQLGYHFIVVLESTSELKQCRFDSEWFTHKLFYQMAKNEAYEIMNSSSASQAEKVPELCCRYTNGLSACTFRPLLHPGISWNNWYVDEDGIPYQGEDEDEDLLM